MYYSRNGEDMRKYYLEDSIPKHYPKELVELMIKCDQSDRTSPRDFYNAEKHKNTPLYPFFYAVNIDEFIEGLIHITPHFEYDGMYGLSYSTISLNDDRDNFKKDNNSLSVSIISMKVYIEGRCYPVSVVYSYGSISVKYLPGSFQRSWDKHQIEEMKTKVGSIETNKQRALDRFINMCREAKNETV